MIRVVARWSFVLVLGMASVSAEAPKSGSEVSQIPVRVVLDTNFGTHELNQPFAVVVTLKNLQNATVPAQKEEKVELRYQQQTFQVTIGPGQSTASVQVTPHSVGIWRIEVTGQSLAGSSGFVQCIDSKAPLRKVVLQPLSNARSTTKAPGPPRITFSLERSPAAGASAPSAAENRAPASAPPPPPPSSPAESQQAQVSLKAFVSPNPVNPLSGTGQWRAQITLALMTASNELLAASEDLHLHLLADVGQISPADVVIKKDDSSTFLTPATLTSSRPGTDTIHVLSSLPEVQQSIIYANPQPAALRLEASPPSVVNDGKTPVHITVMVVAADNTPVTAPAAIDISLATTRGSLPATTNIASGGYFSSVDLSSAQNGKATVRAQAPGLPVAQISATFLFPWLMVSMAAVGGLLGAIVKHPQSALSRHAWKPLALGLICGVVLSIAALFGVVGALPKLDLPIQVSNIPSLNTLGALLLGFVGGFYGRKLWSNGGTVDDAPAPDKKTVGQVA